MTLDMDKWVHTVDCSGAVQSLVQLGQVAELSIPEIPSRFLIVATLHSRRSRLPVKHIVEQRPECRKTGTQGSYTNLNDTPDITWSIRPFELSGIG